MTAGSYWHGCNYPWSFDGTTAFYGLDFGANVWGSHLGVSTRQDAVARDFGEMARLGFTVTRWFLFCDGRGGSVYDDRGLPEGLDAQLFDDLDAALEIALATGVRVAFVLLAHRWMYEGLTGAVVDPVTLTMSWSASVSLARTVIVTLLSSSVAAASSTASGASLMLVISNPSVASSGS